MIRVETDMRAGWLSLDLRALALFRICLGVLLLADIVGRFPYIEFFLSDSGVLSRSVLFEELNRPWAFSLYFLNGRTEVVQLLFLLQAVLAIGLIAGVKARWCAGLSWLLLLSLQNRNPLVLNGGDTLFCLLLFWAMFLPLDGRLSLEPGVGRRLRTSWRDMGSIAYFFQIVLLYWTAAAFKTDPEWVGGTAIQTVMQYDRLLKPFAYVVRESESLLLVLNYATLALEWLGPCLLLLPVRSTLLRMLVVVSFWSLHLGIWLTMEIGLFPWICMVAWVPFVPGAVFSRLGWNQKLIQDEEEREDLSNGIGDGRLLKLHGPEGTSTGWESGWQCRVVASLALLLVVVWNVRSFYRESWRSEWDGALQPVVESFRLRQHWSMFSPGPPTRDGWHVFRGRTFGGEEIDLLKQGAALTWEKPQLVSSIYPDRRWSKYLEHLGKRRYRELRGPYGDYFVGQWNQAHDVAMQVEEVELYFIRERTTSDGEGEPEPIRLWYRKNIRPYLGGAFSTH